MEKSEISCQRFSPLVANLTLTVSMGCFPIGNVLHRQVLPALGYAGGGHTEAGRGRGPVPPDRQQACFGV